MDESILFKLIKTQEWDKLIKGLNDTLDLNIQDDHMNYIIQYAIIENKCDAIKQLLKYNIIVDWIDTNGKTILYEPIRYNRENIIDILLKYDKHNIGISLLNNKDANGNYPIHYALKYNNKDLFIKILNDSKITLLDKDNNTLLHLAIKEKKLEYINIIINKSINMDSQNKHNESALHIASTYANNSIIQILIDNDIDMDIQEHNYGFTGLMICILNNNCEGTKIIVNNKKIKDSHINLQDNDGNTAMHLAINENSLEIMDIILNKKLKFDYNSVNIEGNTCLQLIFYKIISGIKFKLDTVDLFIKNTILNIQNNNGETVWHSIIKYKLFNIYNFDKNNNNLFIKNMSGITPYDYVDKLNDDDKNKLNIMIIESYYKQLGNNHIWLTEWENDCTTKKLDKKQCLLKIKDMFINKHQSVPTKRTTSCENIDVIIDVPFTTFTGINFDIITSYICLVKQHENTMSSITNEFMKNSEVSDYYKNLGIVKDLDNEYLNFEIFWIFQQLIFPTNLESIIKLFHNSKKEFLIIPLAIELHNGAHANCIIIDKRFKTIERFEPHGKKEPINFVYNRQLLDSLLEKYFEQFLPKYKYLSPEETQFDSGFQRLETHETDKYKKIGDPSGFCVMWCLWYIEQRVKNNIHPLKLSKKLLIHIKTRNISFKQLIRKYSVDILLIRNQILDTLGLDINDVMNGNITQQNKQDLIKTITLELIDT